jgi:hypothetical protein
MGKTFEKILRILKYKKKNKEPKNLTGKERQEKESKEKENFDITMDSLVGSGLC